MNNNNMTFHCQLILKNDEECAGVCDCLVSHVMNRVYHDYNGEAYADQKRVRIYALAKLLRGYIEEVVDVENEYRFRSPMENELILGAIQEIDFRQIAEDVIGDYSPKSPAEIAESEEYFAVRGFDNYDIED